MDRSLTPAMQSAMASDTVSIFYLVEAHFDSGTIYATDAHRDIIWGGNTYRRTNGLLSFGGLSETGQLLVNKVSVSMSGVDTAGVLAAALGDDFLDRPLKIYLGLFDTDSQVIADPELIFSGRMDAPTFSEDPDGQTSTVTIQGTPAYADFGRRPGRHTNDSEQQASYLFPGDKGFEFVSEIPRSIVWGRN